MSVAMLCTSSLMLRTFSIQQICSSFHYEASILDDPLQDLRGKVGKGGVAGGTRLLGTDRSVLMGSLAGPEDFHKKCVLKLMLEQFEIFFLANNKYD